MIIYMHTHYIIYICIHITINNRLWMTNNQKEEWSWMPHDACRIKNPNGLNPFDKFFRIWVPRPASGWWRPRSCFFFSGEKDWDPTFSAVEVFDIFLLVVLKNSKDVNFTVSEDGRISVIFTRCDNVFLHQSPQSQKVIHVGIHFSL